MLTLRLGDPPLLAGGVPPAIATIGNFDGVHLGHRYLLQGVVQEARRRGLASLVVTFWPHPRALLQPATWPGYLTTFEERRQLLEDCGLTVQLTMPFSMEFAALAPAAFVGQLTAAVPLAELWVGEDFRFGHRRAGDVALLRQLCAEHGVMVRAIARRASAAGNISSSTIRAQVQAGAVAAAAQLLGRPYRLGGTVVPGDRRGRHLGFPTANLAPDAGKIIPGRGIYAALAHSGAATLQAAVSIGVRPQFDGEAELVEAYLLDFSGDLYGQRLDLDFYTELRQEARFASVDELVRQMNDDVREVRERLPSAVSLPGKQTAPDSSA